MADVEDVAQIIINYMNAEEEPCISNMVLNKLLYFTQGHCLAETGKPLFDDDFEAWELGPVIPKIYHKYKTYGKGNIVSNDYIKEENILNDEQLDLLERVLEKYSIYSPTKLVDMTHEQGTPWANVTQNKKKIEKHLPLSKQQIEEYFQNHRLENDNFDDLLEQVEVVEAFEVKDKDEEEARQWASAYNDFLQGRSA